VHAIKVVVRALDQERVPREQQDRGERRKVMRRGLPDGRLILTSRMAPFTKASTKKPSQISVARLRSSRIMCPALAPKTEGSIP